MLETTPVSIDSALQRAHRTVDDRLPSQSQQRTLRLLGDEELSRLVERYMSAWERNDVDAMVTMLAADARMVMPPLSSWYGGRDQVAAFLRGYVLEGAEEWRRFPMTANGQPAVAAYVWNDRADAFVAHCVNVLTLRDGRIQEIAAFLDADVFPRFSLARTLTPA